MTRVWHEPDLQRCPQSGRYRLDFDHTFGFQRAAPPKNPPSQARSRHAS
jgi:hypothetical protein